MPATFAFFSLPLPTTDLPSPQDALRPFRLFIRRVVGPLPMHRAMLRRNPPLAGLVCTRLLLSLHRAGRSDVFTQPPPVPSTEGFGDGLRISRTPQGAMSETHGWVRRRRSTASRSHSRDCAGGWYFAKAGPLVAHRTPAGQRPCEPLFPAGRYTVERVPPPRCPSLP